MFRFRLRSGSLDYGGDGLARIGRLGGDDGWTCQPVITRLYCFFVLFWVCFGIDKIPSYQTIKLPNEKDFKSSKNFVVIFVSINYYMFFCCCQSV